jgi:hypothetical protein
MPKQPEPIDHDRFIRLLFAEFPEAVEAFDWSEKVCSTARWVRSGG